MNYEETAKMNPTEDYLNLRWRVDREVKRLTAMHGRSITCGPRCDGCCVNLTVFPVEFFSIEREMRCAGLHPEEVFFDESALCGFLHDRLCRIYQFRPIICRTHGLPILFIDDLSDGPKWEVSFCEQNFRNCDQIEFTDDMLLDIEKINAELNRMNHSFIASLTEKKYQTHSRIPLKELCSTKIKRSVKGT
jgi:uncharacterized protein